MKKRSRKKDLVFLGLVVGILRVKGAVLVFAIAAVLLLGASLAPAQIPVPFNIQQSQSELTVSGQLLGSITLQEQSTGSLTTSYQGTINSMIAPGSSIQFVSAAGDADVSGTYQSGGMGPMSQTVSKPGYRMLGAIIDTKRGPWFFKLTGPVKTVEKWLGSWEEFVDSLHVTG